MLRFLFYMAMVPVYRYVLSITSTLCKWPMCVSDTYTLLTLPPGRNWGYSPDDQGDLISLTCDNSTVSIQYNNDNFLYSNIVLNCMSADNSSVSVTKSMWYLASFTRSFVFQLVVHHEQLVCDKFGNVDDKTLTLAATGLELDDRCVISGCYEDDITDSFLLRIISCTISRMLRLCM